MGDSEEKDWAHPVAALEPYAVTAVVAGSRNSLAICQDGRVRPPASYFFPLPCSSNKPSESGLPVAQLFTWGWNQRGTLGHPPETKTESCPGPVDALAGVRIVQAAIGGWHCLAVDDKGRAYAWGEGNQLPPAALSQISVV
jgi:alpha-tubulin suppressor-like RCC1 family protein